MKVARRAGREPKPEPDPGRAQLTPREAPEAANEARTSSHPEEGTPTPYAEGRSQEVDHGHVVFIVRQRERVLVDDALGRNALRDASISVTPKPFRQKIREVIAELPADIHGNETADGANTAAARCCLSEVIDIIGHTIYRRRMPPRRSSIDTLHAQRSRSTAKSPAGGFIFRRT